MGNIKIFSCRQREEMAFALCNRLKLSAGSIVFDGRHSQSQSFCYEVSKAWERFDVSNDSGWSMLIQDDVEPCDGFIDIVGQIMAAHPNTIFSFFPYYYMDKTVTVDKGNPFWEAEIVSGCCIAVPNRYIGEMIQYMRRQKHLSCGEDLVIGWFAHENKIPILTTIPAIVQHVGDVSVIDPSKPIRRTQYFERDPVANWASQKINKFCKSS